MLERWLSARTDRDDPRTAPVRLDHVAPLLHHLPALWQVLGTIVGGTHLVRLLVRELALDHVRPESRLVERRRRDCPEAMPGHLSPIAEAVERKQHGVVADRLFGVAPRQDEPAFAGEFAQLA